VKQIMVGTLFVCSLFGQNAEVSGFVRDASGAVIPAAKVRVINQDTATERVTTPDGSGLYSVPALPPGHYRMTASADGFETESRNDITVETAQDVRIDFTLKIGTSKEVVTVSGNQIYLNQSDATVSTVVDRQFVENIPLNGETLQSLLTLVPGVSMVPGSGQVGYQGEITVNGQRTEANYFTVDGVSANSGAKIDNETGGAGYSGAIPGMTIIGTTQTMVSLDDLQEFRAATSTYSAEFGRTPGGQFAFTTRSGTNSYHGTLFDDFRNDALDAANWFNHYYNPAIDVLNTPNDFPKAAERQNDFGGTVGGPVKIPGLYDGKDKTFIFVSYEGMRLVQPVPPSNWVVPDLAMRAAAPAALRPFLNAYAIQNGSELTQSPGLANYILVYSEPSGVDSASVRIDHSFGNKLQVFARYADSPSGGWYFNDLPIHDNIRVNTQSITLGATSMITPTQTNELRFNFTYNASGEHEIASNFGGAVPISVGIVDGPNGQPLNPIGSQLTFRTYFTTGGKAEFELEGNDYDQYQYNLTDTYHLTHGAHALKLGVDWRRIATYAVPSITKEEVEFTDEAQVLANAASTVENVPHAIVKSEPVFTNFSAFVQDEWKVAPRLSLSLGLRWDVNPPPGNEIGYLPYTLNQISNLATATLSPTNTPLYKTQRTGFAPRFGLAYQLAGSSGHETVLRAGAGLFYDLNSLLSSTGFSNYIGFATSVSYSGVPFPLTPAQLTLPPVSLAPPYDESVLAFDPNLRLPYTLQWNVALEQRLGRNQTLTASYVASLGKDLITQFEYSPQALGNANFAASSVADVVSNQGYSSYNALQVKFQRDLAHGLQMLASYTWSHSIDDATSNFLLDELLRGSSDFDIRQNFQAAFTYSVPGSYSNPILAHLLKYWGLDGRISARSALPLDLVGSTGIDPVTQAVLNYEPNIVPGQPLYLYGPQLVDGQMINPPGGRVININAFSAAPANVNGDSGRNLVRGFGAFQVDAAVRRDFSITERIKLQFRAEAFNVFNHPQFSGVDGTLTDGNGQFGWASTTLNNAGSALSPLFVQGGPRSIQLALKLRF
jgi:hypothetical protein